MYSVLILALAMAASDPVPSEPAADEHMIAADDWARPRSGARVAALPALRSAVQDWIERPGAGIEIVHPGGETGSLWGAELRDWLVALGVAPDKLSVRAGSPRDDAIVVRIERRR